MGDSRLKLVKTQCSFQILRNLYDKINDELVFSLQTFVKNMQKCLQNKYDNVLSAE